MTKWQDITKHGAQTRTFSLLNWTKLFERRVTTQVESSLCVCVCVCRQYRIRFLTEPASVYPEGGL